MQVITQNSFNKAIRQIEPGRINVDNLAKVVGVCGSTAYKLLTKSTYIRKERIKSGVKFYRI